MRKRDGLLLAPVLLMGVMIGSFIFGEKPLSSAALWTITALSGASILSYVLLSRSRLGRDDMVGERRRAGVRKQRPRQHED